MFDYEKLGQFYLGREYDLEARQPTAQKLLYDAKDLTTHAVCVGMTGSGKTGLCLALLEEAAIDNIPAIVIDPKGDLGNLLLTFPNLESSDFKDWVDPVEATRRGMTVEQLAQDAASTWRKGLVESDQPPERIQKFRDATDLAIYTPGGTAGLSLTVLKSFKAPDPLVIADHDLFRERVGGAVSGLLALLGISGDVIRSREHILLSTILERAWKSNHDVDMPTLIREIQAPSFTTIGVMDIESIFPAPDRFKLSMALNNLLASPGFSAWLEGEELDVARLLHTPEGKPRISILSIAHLSDAERMFFVTILLNEVLAWMRSQSGTSSLRAILYMDEVFGFFPPVANPPSKSPMLTLLKQARAFGLGVMLATQNPADLDYKGLQNAGTWLIGRLQTERDKMRVLDGLEGASVASGSSFDRAQMDRILSALGKRVFLLSNAHEDKPVIFQSRFVMSYLRGPLTRQQITLLMAPRKTAALMAAPGGEGTSSSSKKFTEASGQRPVLPPEITEVFLHETDFRQEGHLVYKPALLGSARMHFTQTRAGVDTWENLSILKLIDDRNPGSWEDGEYWVASEPGFDKKPATGSVTYGTLPAELTRAKSFGGLSGDLRDILYRDRPLTIYRAEELKQYSRPGEDESAFRARLNQASKERRDMLLAKLHAKYAPKLKLLEERERRAKQKVEREQAAASQQKMSSMLSMGSSILGAVFGRKLGSASNISKAATAARNFGRMSSKQQSVEQANESLQAIADDRANLELEFQKESAEIDLQDSPQSIQLEALEIRAKKTDINVSRVAIAWVPFRRTDLGELRRTAEQGEGL